MTDSRQESPTTKPIEPTASAVERRQPAPPESHFDGGRRIDAAHGIGPWQSARQRDLHYLLHIIRTALPLAICDQLILLSAGAVSTWMYQLNSTSSPVNNLLLGVSLSWALLIAFVVGELYPGVGLTPATEWLRCSVSTSMVFVLFLLGAQLYGFSSTMMLISVWLICLAFIPPARYLTRRIFCQFSWWMHPAVVVGNDSESKSLLDLVESSPHMGLQPLGLLDDTKSAWMGSKEDDSNRASPYALCSDERSHPRIYCAIAPSPDWPHIENMTEAFCRSFPHVLVIPRILGSPLVWAGQWKWYRQHVHLSGRLQLSWARTTKRAIDLCVVILGGLMLTPLILLIAVSVKCFSRGPIFFSQRRIGRDGRPFRIWKFRTMVADAEDVLHDYLEQHPELCEEWERERKLANDPRIIPWLGQFLRKSSLDELPQLWNVLVGEMSLVGPRPLPQYHLDQFDASFCEYRARVTPGITGLWQVASRSSNYPEMIIKCDSYYIQNWNLWLDLQLLVRTTTAVLSGNGE